MPGSLSRATGLVKNSNSVCLNGQPLHRELEARLGRPLRFANDADCFALSEATDGAGRDAALVFGVIVGTGTGGGIVSTGNYSRDPMALPASGDTTPLPWPRAGGIAGTGLLLRPARVHRNLVVRSRSGARPPAVVWRFPGCAHHYPVSRTGGRKRLSDNAALCEQDGTCAGQCH